MRYKKLYFKNEGLTNLIRLFFSLVTKVFCYYLHIIFVKRVMSSIYNILFEIQFTFKLIWFELLLSIILFFGGKKKKKHFPYILKNLPLQRNSLSFLYQLKSFKKIQCFLKIL